MPVELPREDSAIRVFAQSAFPLPVLRYLNPDGEPVFHQPKPDRWTLINLWVTWCDLCRAELQDLTTHAAELEAAGIDVVALSVDLPNEFSKDSPLAIEAAQILEQIEFPFPHGFAEAGLISHLQGLNDNLTSLNRDLPVPCRFLINPRRQVVAIYKGRVPIDEMLRDAAKPDYLIEERLQKAITLGGSLVPSETVRKAGKFREAGFQFYVGREVFPSSAALAAGHFTESLRIDPDFLEPRIHLGIALNKLNQLEAAKQHLQFVLSRQPGDEERSAALYQLSEIALRQGQIEDAMKYLESTVRYHPDHSLALNNLGYFLASQNEVKSAEFQRALTMAERAVELSEGRQPHFLDTLGGIYAKAERFEEAVESFEKALTLAEEEKKEALASKLHPKLKACREKLKGSSGSE